MKKKVYRYLKHADSIWITLNSLGVESLFPGLEDIFKYSLLKAKKAISLIDLITFTDISTTQKRDFLTEYIHKNISKEQAIIIGKNKDIRTENEPDLKRQYTQKWRIRILCHLVNNLLQAVYKSKFTASID